MPLNSLLFLLAFACVAVVLAEPSAWAEPPPFELDESVADQAVPSDDGDAESEDQEEADIEEISGRYGNDSRQRLEELREWLRRREAERAESGEIPVPYEEGLGESTRVLDFREGHGYVPDPFWQRRALRRHFAGWARHSHFSRLRHHSESASYVSGSRHGRQDRRGRKHDVPQRDTHVGSGKAAAKKGAGALHVAARSKSGGKPTVVRGAGKTRKGKK